MGLTHNGPKLSPTGRYHLHHRSKGGPLAAHSARLRWCRLGLHVDVHGGVYAGCLSSTLAVGFCRKAHIAFHLSLYGAYNLGLTVASVWWGPIRICPNGPTAQGIQIHELRMTAYVLLHSHYSESFLPKRNTGQDNWSRTVFLSVALGNRKGVELLEMAGSESHSTFLNPLSRQLSSFNLFAHKYDGIPEGQRIETQWRRQPHGQVYPPLTGFEIIAEWIPY